MIAVILGCDVFVGGITGLGVKKVYEKMKTLREEHGNDGDEQIIEGISDWACNVKKTNITRDLLDVYVDALIFEPTNEVTEEGEIIFEANANNIDGGNTHTYSYLYSTPTSLPKYLKEFKSEGDTSINITKGPGLCRCVGPNHECSHIVMSNEYGGVKECNNCQEHVCMTCSMKEKASWSLCAQQVFEHNTPNQDAEINSLVADVYNIRKESERKPKRKSIEIHNYESSYNKGWLKDTNA